MDNSDTQELKKTLQNLIEQTYVIENEYKILNENYLGLKAMITGLVEILPLALWVSEEGGELALQNQEAARSEGLFEEIKRALAAKPAGEKAGDGTGGAGEATQRPSSEELELIYEGRAYLVKFLNQQGKKIVLATEITEAKRQERLASMGAIAAHLAHEIRNPIGSIALLASSLLARDPTQQALAQMQAAIARVERIIKSTLLFTRGVVPVLAKCELAGLRAECEAAIASATLGCAIDFELDFCEAKIHADRALLGLVLQNFIFNAIDAIEEKMEGEELRGKELRGQIRIAATAEAGKITVRVYDNGAKVREEHGLFEAFKTTKLRGHGLGLSLSREIIKAHGGEIGYEEEPKNFYFVLEGI